MYSVKTWFLKNLSVCNRKTLLLCYKTSTKSIDTHLFDDISEIRQQDCYWCPHPNGINSEINIVKKSLNIMRLPTPDPRAL